MNIPLVCEVEPIEVEIRILLLIVLIVVVIFFFVARY